MKVDYQNSFTLRFPKRFSLHLKQRIKIGNVLSSWLTLNSSMSQGPWLLRFFSFIVLSDGLKLPCPTHKYVDDIPRSQKYYHAISLSAWIYLNELRQWSVANYMLINEHKTKEFDH